MARQFDLECYRLLVYDRETKTYKLEYLGSYRESIRQVIEYFRHSPKLYRLKGVERVFRQGCIIRPQFTGNRKSYGRKAIGLTISISKTIKSREELVVRPLDCKEVSISYGYRDIVAYIGIGSLYTNTAWFLDLSQIYPFTIVRFFKILYNRDKTAMEKLLNKLYSRYREALDETIKHLKTPRRPSLSRCDLSRRIHLVVYRCQRSFVSATIPYRLLDKLFNTGLDSLIISNTVSYLIVRKQCIAYYYSMILNYLVYKTIAYGRRFILNQYGRPLQAIRVARLEWSRADWKRKVASMSKDIHVKTRHVLLEKLGLPRNLEFFELIDRGRDSFVRQCLGVKISSILETLLDQVPEIEYVFRLIDRHTDRYLVEKALDYVSTK